MHPAFRESHKPVPRPALRLFRIVACRTVRQVHTRVLYVDIDVHHGDGVEEAFLTSGERSAPSRVVQCTLPCCRHAVSLPPPGLPGASVRE
jgi:hypothetical protein